MITLRPYQLKMIADARSSLAAGHKRIVLQAPTGSGKGQVIAELIRLATAKRKRVLFMAPRRELIHQTRDILAKRGIFAGVIMAGEPANRLLDVQVASADTLHARGVRSKRIEMPEADLLVIDEAHIFISQSRQDIISHYDGKTVIGLTATPARGDGRGLGEVFEDLVLGPSVRELTEGGFLVPARYFAPSKPDLAGIKLNKDRDYIEGQLGARMDDAKLIGDIVDNWRRIAPDRRTVVFCVNRAHSRHVCQAFCDAGIVAEHLDGETDAQERSDILERVRRGATQVLTNVFVASYGLDIPALDCAVLARPTKNITLYLQTVGRVLRPFPGKADCIVIDHAGAVAENGFADDFVPWSLDGEESVKERKQEAAEKSAAPKELECSVCHTVFKGRRQCPSCGHQVVAETKAIPTHKADLVEMQRSEKRANRNDTWEQKADFMGQLRAYAAKTGKADGWCAHKYREAYGVWPNDPRVKRAPYKPITPEVRNWITSQNIRWAKGRERDQDR